MHTLVESRATKAPPENPPDAADTAELQIKRLHFNIYTSDGQHNLLLNNYTTQRYAG